YGDSGLGKTHLLHAIGYYATQLFPEIRVKYVSSEEFVNDFINTIGSSKTSNALRPAFQRRYREVDILMIDDIQFLQGKDATVEEFFHTFNALHNEASRSSSPPTSRRRCSRASRRGCAPASNGVCSPTCSLRTWRRGS